MSLSEHQEQVILVAWLKKQKLLHFAVPNAGKRGPRMGHWMKMEGLSAGVPDIFICEPAGKYHGLFIELKIKKGKVSKPQKKWIEELNKKNYCARVCIGAEAAIQTVERYFFNNN